MHAHRHYYAKNFNCAFVLALLVNHDLDKSFLNFLNYNILTKDVKNKNNLVSYFS